ncbi:hypothetical protein BJX96DRAFT_145148 [Aspergillus floccosus]
MTPTNRTWTTDLPRCDFEASRILVAIVLVGGPTRNPSRDCYPRDKPDREALRHPQGSNQWRCHSTIQHHYSEVQVYFAGLVLFQWMDLLLVDPELNLMIGITPHQSIHLSVHPTLMASDGKSRLVRLIRFLVGHPTWEIGHSTGSGARRRTVR